VARQHPLLETRPSIEAMRQSASTAPQAVFMGVGLVAEGGVSEALPVDALGLVLGAEEVRRAIDAETLVVLVADTHALLQGAARDAVDASAELYERTLRRVADRCGLTNMHLVRASRLHTQSDYRGVLRSVQCAASAAGDPYLVHEVADIAHFVNEHGALVKVGWALKAARNGAKRDERVFDESFRRWVGEGACFVYTKAGRALDDDRHKAPPYIETDASRRICLQPGEDVAAKLERGQSRISYSTWRGVRKHLNAISRTYSKLVRPLDGPLEERVQAMVDDVVSDERLDGPNVRLSA
jgi:hypothetical protein